MKNSNRKPLPSSHSSGNKKHSSKRQETKEDRFSNKRKSSYSSKNFSRKKEHIQEENVKQNKTQSFEQILELRLGSEKLHKLARDSKEKLSQLLEKSPTKIIQDNKILLPLKEEVSSSLRGFALAKFKRQQQQALLQNKEVKFQNQSKLESLDVDLFYTPEGLLLDAWQKDALDALLEGKHVVVDAPTSAGKTRVIEALLEYKLKEGIQLIYTSPVKSLSNDKYREFSDLYGR